MIRFKRPTHGLDFITYFWIAFPIVILVIAPTALPPAFLLLAVGGLSSAIGICAGLRFCGYLFAVANLAAMVALSMIAAGFWDTDFTLSYKHILAAGVWLYGTIAGVLWAQSNASSVAHPRREEP